ncbi:MAG TPA: DNA recombination protein RmuC [Candidatus Poseidoniaceae archaeon]|nr:DNA recombination protein RmuC [Candidatus Poseidoniaceae archaeon]
MTDVLDIVVVVIASCLGIGLGWLLAKMKFSTELVRAEVEAQAAQGNKAILVAEMENVATAVARQNSEDFLRLAEERWKSEKKDAEHALETRKTEVENLVKPLKEEMEKMIRFNNDMEKERMGAYEGIKRHLKDLGDKTESLSTRTTALSTALTTSGQTRGNWGEVKLRRLFEMAGLSEHVDFFEQVTLEDGSRPDFVVRLPQEAVLPIDSKATGSHFLQALELDSGPQQDELLLKHAKAMKQRITELSAKAYQNTIEGEFDHVIMFIPSEAMAASAFSSDPELMDYAMSKSVLIATPVTMLGLLRTVALYWQQHALAEGAKEIYDVSRELYKRVNKMIEHFSKVGGHLSNAAKTYNETMNSYETRVLPQGRRLDDLKVSETLQTALPEPKDIEHLPKE